MDPLRSSSRNPTISAADFHRSDTRQNTWGGQSVRSRKSTCCDTKQITTDLLLERVNGNKPGFRRSSQCDLGAIAEDEKAKAAAPPTIAIKLSRFVASKWDPLMIFPLMWALCVTITVVSFGVVDLGTPWDHWWRCNILCSVVFNPILLMRSLADYKVSHPISVVVCDTDLY